MPDLVSKSPDISDIHAHRLGGGQLCAILVLLLLQQVFLAPEQLRDWGWRVPFFIGALLAIVAAVMRGNLYETEAFIEAQNSITTRTSSLRALMNYPCEVLLVVGLTAGGVAARLQSATAQNRNLGAGMQVLRGRDRERRH